MGTKKGQQLFKNLNPFNSSKNKQPETAPVDLAAEMRKNADIVIRVLAATDIEGSNLSDEVKNRGKDVLDGFSEEELHRQNLIQHLQESPTISDDMREIDKYLLKFAQYYQEAARDGRDTTFHWAGNALARAIIVRQNLRMEDEEFRAQDYANRVRQMDDYDQLLIASKALDDTMIKDAQATADYHANATKFNETHKKIIEYIASSEGGKVQQELEKNPRQADGIWSDEARNLNQLYNDLVRAELSVIRSAIWMDENKESMARYEDALKLFREAVRQQADIYGKKISAELEMLTERQRKLLEETMYRNNAIRERITKHTGAMQVIATESDEAKQRAYLLNKNMQHAIELAEKQKAGQMIDEPSPYADLLEIKQTQERRVLTSIE